MVKKSHGLRSATRRKLRKKVREKKLKVTPYLQEFDIGQKVVIDPEPASQKGMPFRRYIGRVGVVKEKRGNAYLVEIKNGKKTKIIISNPEHLKPVK